jgi:predicted nucleotidyltransferase
MVRPELLAAVHQVIDRMPAVRVVTLFGSHARAANDSESDIDLQIITARPEQFHDSSWLEPMPCALLAYGLRPASGRVVKATAVFAPGEVDIVVLPLFRVQLARAVVRLGLHRRSMRLRRVLGDLAIVLRPGYRVLKGSTRWAQFFAKIVSEVPDPRFSDVDVVHLADCAFADYISLRRKISRGELIAAQRWLHVHLVETNLKLMHERQLRAGGMSFHDGRRVEQTWTSAQLEQVRVNARLDASELLAAANLAIGTTHLLVWQLTGSFPRWSRPATE